MKWLPLAACSAALAVSGCYDPDEDLWEPETVIAPQGPAGDTGGQGPVLPGATGSGGDDLPGASGAGGRAGASAAGGGSAGTSSAVCVPELASPSVLPVGCDGESYFTRLALRCTDPDARLPEVEWRPLARPAGINIMPDGEVRGVASTGQYVLQAEMSTGDVTIPIDLELEVVERCWVFALTDASIRGEPRAQLRAARLDTGEASSLPLDLDEAESVSSFDLSSDGRFLTLVLESPLQPAHSLRLFRVSGGRIEPVLLSHIGRHVAHAFSPDSSRLAIVTDLNDDPDAPDDTRLGLIALSAEMPAVELDESFVAGYELGLGWADASTIQFLGPWSQDPTVFFPQVVSLGEAASLGGALRSEIPFVLEPSLPLLWTRSTANGLQIMGDFLTFVERPSGLSTRDFDAGALSPSFSYSAGAVDGQLSVRAARYSSESPQVADGCERLLSWSADDSTLLCLAQGKLRRFGDPSAPRQQEQADLGWSPSEVRRAAFSRTGRWLALVDRQHGAHLLERGAAAPLSPSIAASSDDVRWDAGFTRDERHAWIQNGTSLALATLESGAAPSFVPVTDQVRAAPACADAGLPLPGEWCGAPELDGAGVVVERDGRHLAFTTIDGVSIVDMAAPSRTFSLGAPPSSACSHQCTRFQ